MADAPKGTPLLEIRGLNVFYGASHALQGVDLVLPSGTLSVVGRNGMGKTTLCKTIVGLQRAASGSIRFRGQDISRQTPAAISALGIGYVPQGRRLWPSLTVDEHLRLTMAGRRGAWSPERVYDTFPRLAERKANRGNQLSGGEQQMLAISRALLLDPKLLVMDEPTEGLAPVIVAHVEELLVGLAAEGTLSVLIIEQNIGVATAVADQVAIMVNGRVNRTMPSAALAADRALQQRLLGVGRPGEGPAEDVAHPAAGMPDAPAQPKGPTRVYLSNPVLPTRWSAPVPVARILAAARTVTAVAVTPASGPALAPLSSTGEPVVLVAGTFDTKGEDLRHLAGILRGHGHRVRLVDLSTSGRPSAIEIPPHQIAAFHRRGAAGVFTGDQNTAVPAMAEAFAAWLRRQSGIAGIIAAGGAQGAQAVAAGMQVLPVGVPKLIVSTVAADQAVALVGASDILLLPCVTDAGGLNVVSRQVLGNAAEAMAGMIAARAARPRATQSARPDLPPLGVAFDATTEGTAATVTALLRGSFDCIPFKGASGALAMERMAEAGQLSAMVDLSAADIATHLLAGGPGEDRLTALTRRRLPAVLALGGLDAVAFSRPEAVPPHLAGRRSAPLGATALRVRLSPAEASDLGRWIAERLNRGDGPLRLLLPTGGLSAQGIPGAPLHDPAADDALFAALDRGLRQTGNRQVIRLPQAIDDPAFAAAIAQAVQGLSGRSRRKVTA